ncbi:peptide deformylase [Magnetospirillum sp. UT-4]|uniref:peptide deformylase n=1 Tax=Magnetospirillum sp. UT-4 TaxID=2681467 RepID=UPI0013806F9F|nr:peptide deformylase [Magnetospirillum sp. UT-4]CAA7613559.1 Peptide deformylase 2 [Magnetospirillum sp. UT-4]
MPILKIARMGHPVLARPAEPVADPTAPDIRRLVADMIETLEDAGGAGLAAPQVHVPLRVVVFRVPPGRDAPKQDGAGEVPLTVLVNPVVEPLDGELRLGYEGCLSIPGLTGAVPRFHRVRYRGFGLDGAVVEREAEGFHARVAQHECDHLDGVLYPARMPDLATFGFVEEVKRTMEQSR